MANIKNLQMWKDICADARISISKSLFGLKTTAIYNPTQSVVNVQTLEYTPQDGDHLRSILSVPRKDLAEAIKDFHPKEAHNGNYLLEVCRSCDCQFVAVLLQQFKQMSYEPVTDTLIFEGEGAKIICQML
jgi:hypothetical protein